MKFKLFFTLLCINSILLAQQTAVVPLLSPPATISQRIGVSDISIKYSKPKVKGREIWGNVVPYGYNHPNAIKRDNSSPWRAGAEEATTITFSDDVTINNQVIKKGEYLLFISVFKNGTADIIINNATGQFGSFFYKSDFNIITINVKTESVSFIDDLEYGFKDIDINSAVVYLQWEKLRIPFKIEIDSHKNTLINLLQQEKENKEQLNWQWREKAALYCINYKVHLKEGLRWAEEALDTINFKGSRNYNTLANYANLLLLNNKPEVADIIIDEVLIVAGVNFSQFYGDQLLELKYPLVALRVWDYLSTNASEKGWIYENGYARSYSALGEYIKAINHLNKAKKYLPEDYDVNKIEDMIKKLKLGKSIN